MRWVTSPQWERVSLSLSTYHMNCSLVEPTPQLFYHVFLMLAMPPASNAERLVMHLSWDGVQGAVLVLLCMLRSLHVVVTPAGRFLPTPRRSQRPEGRWAGLPMILIAIYKNKPGNVLNENHVKIFHIFFVFLSVFFKLMISSDALENHHSWTAFLMKDVNDCK